MAFDSSIRLKQINQSDLSGFVIPIILGYITGTGSLTGTFYPLKLNPSGYLQSGAFISQIDLDSAIYQQSVYNSDNFYPLNSNPAGYLTIEETGSLVITGNSGSLPVFLGTGLGNSIIFQESGNIGLGNSNPLFNLDVTGLIGNSSNNTGTSIDVGNGFLYDNSGNLVISWTNDILYSPLGGGEPSLDWYNDYLYDQNFLLSLDWNNRLLCDYLGHTSIDYTNKILSGQWTGQYANFISGLRVSGNSVVTGGPYYLANNPSGYITGVNTNSFITTGQTGIFATAANLTATGSSIATWTGLSTGLYYPHATNPSGYITTGQTGSFGGNTGILTGVFYPLIQNPNAYIPTGDLVNNNFIVSGQWDFEGINTNFNYLTPGGSLSIYGTTRHFSDLDVWDTNNNLIMGLSPIQNVEGYPQLAVQFPLGAVSGYVFTSDSSGYCTWQPLAVSGNLVVTGAVVRPTQTGAFYPTSNPSGYITGINTGIFLNNYNTTLTGNFNLNPLLSSGIITLGSNPFYIFTGNITVTWALPVINTSTGRMYYLKNRGSSIVILSGNGTDNIYSTSGSNTFNMNPTESYVLANDGFYWNVL